MALPRIKISRLSIDVVPAFSRRWRIAALRLYYADDEAAIEICRARYRRERQGAPAAAISLRLAYRPKRSDIKPLVKCANAVTSSASIDRQMMR